MEKCVCKLEFKYHFIQHTAGYHVMEGWDMSTAAQKRHLWMCGHYECGGITYATCRGIVTITNNARSLLLTIVDVGSPMIKFVRNVWTVPRWNPNVCQDCPEDPNRSFPPLVWEVIQLASNNESKPIMDGGTYGGVVKQLRPINCGGYQL